jgi:type II secretory pathway component GspD/PulD (secretin)
VLIAEVDLNNSEEFGVEIGLQSPILFQRSIPVGPADTSFTTAFSNASSPASPVGFPVVPGVTISSSTTPSGNPAFNFNNPSIALGNNPVVQPGSVAFQGLGSLGVGRVSPTSGIGGFVFSAASDSFNLLIRALKIQGRIDVLSRPQVMALDNQAAQVAVGRDIPILLGSTLTATGLSQQNISYRSTGVLLNVIPKITPDNRVIMRVTPEVSSLAGTLNLGGGFNAPEFNQQRVDTTVLAQDGETVVLGGLITRSDTKQENKIPWFGDLPLLGALFRYRTQAKVKQELLIIMTPHIVRSAADRERILAEEGRRMDWVLGDVIKTHGPAGMHPLFPRPDKAPPGAVDGNLPGPIGPVVPPVLPGAQGLLHPPRPVGGPAVVPPAPAVMPPAPSAPQPSSGPALPVPGASAMPASERPLAGLSIPRTGVPQAAPAPTPVGTTPGGPALSR